MTCTNFVDTSPVNFIAKAHIYLLRIWLNTREKYR